MQTEVLIGSEGLKASADEHKFQLHAGNSPRKWGGVHLTPGGRLTARRRRACWTRGWQKEGGQL